MTTAALVQSMTEASSCRHDGEIKMKSEKRIARMVGILVFLHLAAGLMVPFIMLHPIVSPRGFLVTAAESALQIRLAVLLLFMGSAIATGIAITALPVLGRYSYVMAWSLVALGVAAFSLQVVDNGRILSLLSLSQEYARTGAGKPEIFQALALVAGAARKWSHYTYLLVAVSWITLLFSMLYRFRLVPRLLAALGLMTSLLQIAGVSLRVIMGFPAEMRLAMPLGPCYLALALWLLVKGFAEPLPAATAAELDPALLRGSR